MELLNEQTSYLLDTGIETLHSQSTEWIENILFWKDETAFLYELLMSNSFKNIRVIRKIHVKKIEDRLVKAGIELNVLKSEVAELEGSLKHMLESAHQDEEDYRSKCELLTEQISAFETGFKKLKKDIFKLSSIAIRKNKLLKK